MSKEQLQDEGFLETGIRHSYIYEPFLEVGGDFLNIARLKDGSYGLIIADVMGHGISAAMATGVLRSAFSIFSKQHGDCPSELMFHMNNHMHEIFSSLFTTAYYALIDPSSSEIRLSKAGHAHPLVWRSKAGALERFDLPGPGLGIKAGMKYTDMTMCIDQGDKVLFYTDGVEEQKNMEGEMYGLERLESQFVCLCKEGREHLIQHLFSDFESFKGNCDYHDDVTLFLLEFVGPPVGDGVA